MHGYRLMVIREIITSIKRFGQYILNASSYPGADCDRDHILVLAKIRIRFLQSKRYQLVLRYNIDTLNDQAIAQNYNIETENRF